MALSNPDIADIPTSAYTPQMTSNTVDEPLDTAQTATEAEAPAECPHCLKPLTLCVCDGIAPIDNKIALVIRIAPLARHG